MTKGRLTVMCSVNDRYTAARMRFHHLGVQKGQEVKLTVVDGEKLTISCLQTRKGKQILKKARLPKGQDLDV